MFAIGAVLDGRFRVDGVVGAGGMGIVFTATDIELDRAVCLKVMRPDIASDVSARERFVREARLAGRLRGEHVCRVHDVLVLDDGTACIVMERIDGRDLATEVNRRGPLPVPEALALVDQACAAISEAHALGIVHRDLKPQNLLLSRRLDGTPILKVVDFGIAAAAGDACGTTGGLGSPAFMAPEQARRGRTLDASADVYSLGAVLYFLVTGRPPFVGETPLAVLLALQSERPVAASRWRRDLPGSVERVIMRCLERRPESRFPDAGALRTALANPGAAARRSRGRFAIPAIACALAVVPVLLHVESADVMVPSLVITEHPDEPRIEEAITRREPAIARPRRALARHALGGSPRTPQPQPEAGASASIETPAVVAPVAVEPRAAVLPRCRTDDFLCEFGDRR